MVNLGGALSTCLRAPHFITPCGKTKGGFTLLELVAVCFIIAILASLVVGIYRSSLNRFEAPVCAANLRNLHVSLSSYMQDRGQWPQLPEGVGQGTSAEEEFWADALLEYGMPQKSWTCPTLRRLAREKTVSSAPKIHYLPSLFDGKSFTPFRWKEIPWAMEVGDLHGNGNLMIFSDGSIRSYKQVYEEVLRSGSYIRK